MAYVFALNLAACLQPASDENTSTSETVGAGPNDPAQLEEACLGGGDCPEWVDELAAAVDGDLDAETIRYLAAVASSDPQTDLSDDLGGHQLTLSMARVAVDAGFGDLKIYAADAAEKDWATEASQSLEDQLQDYSDHFWDQYLPASWVSSVTGEPLTTRWEQFKRARQIAFWTAVRDNAGDLRDWLRANEDDNPDYDGTFGDGYITTDAVARALAAADELQFGYADEAAAEEAGLTGAPATYPSCDRWAAEVQSCGRDVADYWDCRAAYSAYPQCSAVFDDIVACWLTLGCEVFDASSEGECAAEQSAFDVCVQ